MVLVWAADILFVTIGKYLIEIPGEMFKSAKSYFIQSPCEFND